LLDIQETIDRINDLVAGVTPEIYANSWAMQRAVERGLEIISEASRHIPPDLKASAPDIPWRQISAIGNLLRHEYQRADVTATWNIVTEHLPPLATAIKQLISEAERHEQG
jgi:uncharacterized protein with HEPN domain